MKNYKKLFIIILSFSMVAFISCGDTTETTGPSTNPEEKPKFKPVDLVGTWTNAVNTDTFEVVDNGNEGIINIDNTQLNIPYWDTKNQEYDLFYFEINLYYFVFDSTGCIFRKNFGNNINYYKQ